MAELLLYPVALFICFGAVKQPDGQIIDEYDAPLLDVAHDMDKLDELRHVIKMDEV